MNVSLLVSIIASASVYAALAVAVVLVYRSNHVLTFHIAEAGVLAAYVMVTVLDAYGQGAGPAAMALGFGAALATALAVAVVMHVVIDRWARPYGHFVGTVLTIAVATLLMGIVSMVWSGEARRLVLADGHLAVGGTKIAWNSIVVIAACLAAVAATHLVVSRTRLGIGMRAVANSAELARLRGIPVPRVLLSAWLIGGCLTALGGVCMAALSSVAMEGAVVGVSAVVAAILGGMTSLGGAILGAVLLAAGEQLVSVYFDARYSQVVPILALVIVLSLRPSGLSGRTESIARV